MTPPEIFRQAQRYGLELKPKHDQLLVFGRACPPEFADLLRQNKPALLKWLSNPPCPGWKAVPPDSLPLNEQQPTPSRADARLVMDFIVRQIGDAITPLCEWCLEREDAYWERFQWPVELCVYAAARDAACWQLDQPESIVADILNFGSACEPNVTK